MENSKNTGYILHDFMKEDLGLSGVALRVYALIYSFTKSGSSCYGSIDYIAQRVGASYKSVQLALNALVAKGYVTKTKTKPKSPSVYKVITDRITDTDSITDTNYRSNDAKLPMPSVKTTDNNKDNNKTHTTTTTNNTYSLRRGGKPLVTMGNKKMLLLTLHEYANLLRVLGVVPTRRYMRNLENRIISHPRYNYDNHYQTIIDWARKDGYVVPAEQ